MHKLSISRAWDETKAVLSRDGKLLAAVALALFVLPGVILGTVTPQESGAEMPRSAPWLIGMFVMLLISLAGQLAVIRLAMGPHLTVGEAIAHGFKRLLPYFGSVLLWLVPAVLLAAVFYSVMTHGHAGSKGLAAIATLILMLVIIYFSVRFLPASGVASAESGGPVTILRRSWALSRGNWWRLFLFLVMTVIAALALLLAVGAIAGLIAKAVFGAIEPLSIGGLFAAIVSQLISASVSVFFFVMLARIYVQLAGRDHAEVSVPSSAD